MRHRPHRKRGSPSYFDTYKVRGLRLDNATFGMLEGLAITNELNNSQMVEQLIKEAFRRETSTTEHYLNVTKGGEYITNEFD